MGNFADFENLVHMKLYSLLMQTKKRKKSRNNFKAPKKSEIVIFPACILPCKQIQTAPHQPLLKRGENF